MRRSRKAPPAGAESAGGAAGHVDDDPTRLYSTVYRVGLPTGETFLTTDAELVTGPVYRCVMPNGTTALLEPPGCEHCRPKVHRVGRRRNRALVSWMCTSGCGYYPPDLGGGPIGGAE